MGERNRGKGIRRGEERDVTCEWQPKRFGTDGFVSAPVSTQRGKGQYGPCMSRVIMRRIASGQIEVGRDESNLGDSIQQSMGRSSMFRCAVS